MEVEQFKLHSQGANWFHFRKDLGSLIESFSVTYCHDGTVCMTGDMGCLTWQRIYFPEKPDYGFPYKGTGIGYFAEKVVRGGECQVITEWDKELADKQIKYTIEERKADERDEDGEYGYFEMLTNFSDIPHDIESEEWCEYGRRYSKSFEMRFELLKSVSDLILEAVAEDDMNVK